MLTNGFGSYEEDDFTGEFVSKYGDELGGALLGMRAAIKEGVDLRTKLDVLVSALDPSFPGSLSQRVANLEALHANSPQQLEAMRRAVELKELALRSAQLDYELGHMPMRRK